MATSDDTREALVSALIDLTRTRSLKEISVREVARHAGVNHGLVHRHFGSKANLVRAATKRITAEVHTPDVGQAAATFRYLSEHPELVRVLAQACLDGRDELLEAASPTPEHVCQVVERIQAGLDDLGLAATPDARVLNAAGISAILGWVLFKPMLEIGYGIDEHADDEVASLLELLDLATTG